MGFLDLAKHGLNKNMDKTKFGLKIGGERTVERGRKEEEKREEEEEEKKKKKRRRGGGRSSKKVWNY